MLDGIRKKSNSLIVLLILGAIIVVFIFWGIGPGGDGGGGNDVVATVDGEGIGLKDFLGFHKRQVEYYREAYKGQFTNEMAQSLDFKHQTLNIMINRALALKAADKAGIKASDNEVREVIVAMPAFSKDGVFNEEQYFRTLSANRLMPAEFEESIKADIRAEKMREKVTGSVSVTEDEVKRAYFDEFRTVDLAYVEVTGDRFARSVKVSEEDARKYLDDNSSEFMIPAQVKAFYAYAEYRDFAGRVNVTEKDIKEFYDRFPQRFEKPGEVRARHILIRVDDETSDPEAKKKAEEVLELVKRGEDFGELAKKLSQDPGSAGKGGDLGWFPRGVMIKDFEETAFSLGKGELSGVVKTEFGYHIIKVDDKRPAEPMPIAEVSDKISEELSRRKGEDSIKEIMETLRREFEKAEGTEALKKAVKLHNGVKSDLTGLFPENIPVKAFAANEKLRDIVFYMSEGRTSNVIATPEGMYVIKLLKRVEPHTPEYSSIAADVKKRLKEIKSTEAAGKAAEELLKRVLAGEDLEKIASREGYKVKRTDYFSRVRGVIPGINAYARDYPALFTLNKESPYFQEVLKANGKFYLLKWKGSREAPEKNLEVVRESIELNLKAAKEEEAMVNWLEGLRSSAKIRVYEDRM